MSEATTILKENGAMFKKKADYYMSRGELEGSLINYLLAGNCFHTLIESGSSDYKGDLTTCMRYIVPLQEKLQQIKRDRGCPKDEEKTKISCTDVKRTDNKLKECFTFDKLAGQTEAKEQIKNGIIMPILYPRLYPHSSKGILFYGPPGTGKTLLATSFVNELQMQADCFDIPTKILLYSPTGAELKGKYVGETEKNIRKYFDCAEKQAKDCLYYQTSEKAKKEIKTEIQKYDTTKTDADMKITRVISVIFIDEVDAIAGDRSKDNSGLMSNSVNTLLQMMDGVNKYDNVIVMAATNYPWSLDDAVMRRFDTKVFVSLPEEEDIKNLIKLECYSYIQKALEPVKPSNYGEAVSEIVKEKPADSDKSKIEFEEQDDNTHTCVLSDLIERKYDLCHSNCYATTVPTSKKFDTYRDLYFSTFDEAELEKIASLYKDSNYSGGDIKNACRYVFKKMGNMAIKNIRYEETRIIDPLVGDNFNQETEVSLDNKKFIIDSKKSDGSTTTEDKKFKLFKSTAPGKGGKNKMIENSELLINLTGKDVQQDLFGYPICSTLRNPSPANGDDDESESASDESKSVDDSKKKVDDAPDPLYLEDLICKSNHKVETEKINPNLPLQGSLDEVTVTTQLGNHHLYMDMNEFLSRSNTKEGYADAFQIIAKILESNSDCQPLNFNGGGHDGGGKRRRYGSKNHLHSYGQISKDTKLLEKIQKGGTYYSTPRTIEEEIGGFRQKTKNDTFKEKFPFEFARPRVRDNGNNISIRHIQLAVNVDLKKTNKIEKGDDERENNLKKMIDDNKTTIELHEGDEDEDIKNALNKHFFDLTYKEYANYFIEISDIKGETNKEEEEEEKHWLVIIPLLSDLKKTRIYKQINKVGVAITYYDKDVTFEPSENHTFEFLTKTFENIKQIQDQDTKKYKMILFIKDLFKLKVCIKNDKDDEVNKTQQVRLIDYLRDIDTIKLQKFMYEALQIASNNKIMLAYESFLTYYYYFFELSHEKDPKVIAEMKKIFIKDEIKYYKQKKKTIDEEFLITLVEWSDEYNNQDFDGELYDYIFSDSEVENIELPTEKSINVGSIIGLKNRSLLLIIVGGLLNNYQNGNNKYFTSFVNGNEKEIIKQLVNKLYETNESYFYHNILLCLFLIEHLLKQLVAIQKANLNQLQTLNKDIKESDIEEYNRKGNELYEKVENLYVIFTHHLHTIHNTGSDSVGEFIKKLTELVNDDDETRTHIDTLKSINNYESDPQSAGAGDSWSEYISKSVIAAANAAEKLNLGSLGVYSKQNEVAQAKKVLNEATTLLENWRDASLKLEEAKDEFYKYSYTDPNSASRAKGWNNIQGLQEKVDVAEKALEESGIGDLKHDPLLEGSNEHLKASLEKKQFLLEEEQKKSINYAYPLAFICGFVFGGGKATVTTAKLVTRPLIWIISAGFSSGLSSAFFSVLGNIALSGSGVLFLEVAGDFLRNVYEGGDPDMFKFVETNIQLHSNHVKNTIEQMKLLSKNIRKSDNFNKDDLWNMFYKQENKQKLFDAVSTTQNRDEDRGMLGSIGSKNISKTAYKNMVIDDERFQEYSIKKKDGKYIIDYDRTYFNEKNEALKKAIDYEEKIKQTGNSDEHNKANKKVENELLSIYTMIDFTKIDEFEKMKAMAAAEKIAIEAEKTAIEEEKIAATNVQAAEKIAIKAAKEGAKYAAKKVQEAKEKAITEAKNAAKDAATNVQEAKEAADKFIVQNIKQKEEWMNTTVEVKIDDKTLIFNIKSREFNGDKATIDKLFKGDIKELLPLSNNPSTENTKIDLWEKYFNIDPQGKKTPNSVKKNNIILYLKSYLLLIELSIGNLSLLAQKDWGIHEKLFVNLHDVYYYMAINSLADFNNLLNSDTGITFIIKTDTYNKMTPEIKRSPIDSRIYLRSILRFKDMNPERIHYQTFGIYNNTSHARIWNLFVNPVELLQSMNAYVHKKANAFGRWWEGKGDKGDLRKYIKLQGELKLSLTENIEQHSRSMFYNYAFQWIVFAPKSETSKSLLENNDFIKTLSVKDEMTMQEKIKLANEYKINKYIYENRDTTGNEQKLTAYICNITTTIAPIGDMEEKNFNNTITNWFDYFSKTNDQIIIFKKCLANGSFFDAPGNTVSWLGSTILSSAYDKFNKSPVTSSVLHNDRMDKNNNLYTHLHEARKKDTFFMSKEQFLTALSSSALGVGAGAGAGAAVSYLGLATAGAFMLSGWGLLISGGIAGIGYAFTKRDLTNSFDISTEEYYKQMTMNNSIDNETYNSEIKSEFYKAKTAKKTFPSIDNVQIIPNSNIIKSITITPVKQFNLKGKDDQLYTLYGPEVKIGNESYTQQINVEFHSTMEEKINNNTKITQIQVKTRKTGTHCIILTKQDDNWTIDSEHEFIIEDNENGIIVINEADITEISVFNGLGCSSENDPNSFKNSDKLSPGGDLPTATTKLKTATTKLTDATNEFKRVTSSSKFVDVDHPLSNVETNYQTVIKLKEYLSEMLENPEAKEAAEAAAAKAAIEAAEAEAAAAEAAIKEAAATEEAQKPTPAPTPTPVVVEEATGAEQAAENLPTATTELTDATTGLTTATTELTDATSKLTTETIEAVKIKITEIEKKIAEVEASKKKLSKMLQKTQGEEEAIKAAKEAKAAAYKAIEKAKEAITEAEKAIEAIEAEKAAGGNKPRTYKKRKGKSKRRRTEKKPKIRSRPKTPTKKQVGGEVSFNRCEDKTEEDQGISKGYENRKQICSKKYDIDPDDEQVNEDYLTFNFRADLFREVLDPNNTGRVNAASTPGMVELLKNYHQTGKTPSEEEIKKAKEEVE